MDGIAKAGTALLMLSGATAALAQNNTAPEAPPAASGLEDIVVTATRREERLQNIPVTVTAVTQSALRSSGLNQIRNLTQVVPGFTGNRNISQNLPVIRGVGSAGAGVADEANVATYVDGVYQPDPFSTFIELVDVERVEVLRGPQGTVFGRNATGGLINIITPDPSFDFSGRLSAQYNHMRNDSNGFDVRGYLTTGLSEKLAVDVAGLYRKDDAYIRDLVRGGNVGGLKVADIRSKLLFEPTDRVRFVLTGEYVNQKSSENAVQPFQNNTAGRAFSTVILPTGPWQTSVNDVPRLDFERYSFAFRSKVDLGGVDFETTTGFMHADIDQLTDSDGSNIFLGRGVATAHNEALSQEIRFLSSNSDKLKWIVGAYFFHMTGHQLVSFQNANGPGSVVSIRNLDAHLTNDSAAGFAEATYELVPSLFLTGGVRYTTEDHDFRQSVNGAGLPFGLARASSNKWTYRGAARYNFAANSNIYISYGTGFKSGVFNSTGTSPDPVTPETIKAWEGGIKAEPLHWLRTNLSAFHYDYQDLQVQARAADGVSYILQNAANAEIYGGELELTAAPTATLNLRASAAYTHGRYKDFPAAQVFIPKATGGNTVTAADVSGRQMIRTPEFSFNAGADWSHETDKGTFRIAANVFHSGTVYYDFANYFKQTPYTMLSGEISWTLKHPNLKFSIFGTNLTDAKVAQLIRPGALDTDLFYEHPRKIGAGVEFNF